jgi:hypothetical protein
MPGVSGLRTAESIADFSCMSLPSLMSEKAKLYGSEPQIKLQVPLPGVILLLSGLVVPHRCPKFINRLLHHCRGQGLETVPTIFKIIV